MNELEQRPDEADEAYVKRFEAEIIKPERWNNLPEETKIKLEKIGVKPNER